VFRGLRIDQVRGLLEKIKINFAGVLNNATFAVPTKKGVWGCVCVCVIVRRKYQEFKARCQERYEMKDLSVELTG